jgi:hypothetical protein
MDVNIRIWIIHINALRCSRVCVNVDVFFLKEETLQVALLVCIAVLEVA